MPLFVEDNCETELYYPLIKLIQVYFWYYQN